MFNPTEITFGRNDSHPKGEATRTLGPFDWVQITYESVRDDNDNEIAAYDEGYWHTPDGESWSDLTIASLHK